MRTIKIDGVEILGVSIHFDTKVDRNLYDLGAVTLSHEDREFILDVAESTLDTEGNGTVIECVLEIDKDIFGECKYDLTALDLYSNTLKAEMFVGGEDAEEEPEYISLFIKDGGSVKAIDVEQE